MHKVLYLCPTSGIGGAETFLRQTFRFCDKELYENHYLLFREGPLYDDLKKMGAQTHLLSRPPRLSKSADRKMVHDQIAAIINSEKIDIVHSTMSYSALFCANLCKKMGVKHVWFEHGPASGWMDRVASVLHHDALATNSHFSAQQQRKVENPLRFFIPRNLPIEKILLGTDIEKPSEIEVTSFRNSLLEKHSIPNDAFLLSLVARIQPWKGVHVLLEALQVLKKMDLPNFHGLIWGEAFRDDRYFKELQKQIADHDLPATLVGSTDNVPLALSASQVVVNASIQPEPFGLTIIEGMAMGCVPVVPNEGGPIEIIVHGSNGLVFESRNPEALAQNLATLIKDPELHKKLSDQALLDAQTKFHSKRAIHHLEQLYEKVLSA